MELVQLIPQQAKVKCQNIISWSWEMLGTFLIMMGGMQDLKSALLLRKSSSDQGESQEKEFTLVLDLDETLIHSEMTSSDPSEKEIQIKCGSIVEKYYVKVRPYVREFLRKMSRLFELVVFTAALKEYADKIIDFIDPEGYIKRRFYRDSCTKKEGIYYKDITKVKQDLSKVCIIDNSISGYCMNYENGLLIKSWYEDKKDKELRTYAGFLEKNVKSGKDFRHVVEHLKKQYPKNILN